MLVSSPLLPSNESFEGFCFNENIWFNNELGADANPDNCKVGLLPCAAAKPGVLSHQWKVGVQARQLQSNSTVDPITKSDSKISW